ncbi:hypothetical protein [Corynebacterium sp.]|uniref:hypothetical protein n=1 Tax=Corynebacterium sp. TaxID=1720 RepID=UPI0027BA422B|nr:hypothetical protein [Corynebacterium sp.]
MSAPLPRIDSADSIANTADAAPDLTEAEALSDAALGAAGHSLHDPHLRELRRLVATGELTGDEAIRRGLDYLKKR